MNTDDISVQDQIKTLICSHLNNYQKDQLKIISLSGLTNKIWKVTCEGKPSLIFRKFSDHFNRDIENQIFKTLEQSNIAPKCYYACSDYRIQLFIQNSVHPTTEDLKDDNLKKKILQVLYRYHGNEVQAMKNKPLFLQEVFTKKYFERVKQVHKNKTQNKNFHELFNLVEAQYEKIDQLKSLFTEKNQEQGKKKIRFCHHDLNNLNIFIKPEVMLIDYQYSDYNYFYYDIANFLNECNMNYKIKEFPHFKVEKMMSLQQIQRLSRLYPQTYTGIERDIVKGLVACNLYWAVWSIIMAYDISQGGFGTVQHGLARMDLYNHYMKFM